MNRPAFVFGVPVEGWSLSRTLDAVRSWRSGERPLWIVTANAEILLKAYEEKAYAEVLKRASVRLCDGSGPGIWLNLFGHRVTRIPGVDLAEVFLQEAQKAGWRVGFFGGINGEVYEAAKEMGEKYPGLVILAEEGGSVGACGEEDEASRLARERLMAEQLDIILVALGHPKQEYWIDKHRAEFPSVRVFVGVGGTFSFWANRVKRAPKFFQVLGIEWFWRLFLQPWRLWRVLRAVIVFSWCFVGDRIA